MVWVLPSKEPGQDPLFIMMGALIKKIWWPISRPFGRFINLFPFGFGGYGSQEHRQKRCTNKSKMRISQTDLGDLSLLTNHNPL